MLWDIVAIRPFRREYARYPHAKGTTPAGNSDHAPGLALSTLSARMDPKDRRVRARRLPEVQIPLLEPPPEDEDAAHPLTLTARRESDKGASVN